LQEAMPWALKEWLEKRAKKEKLPEIMTVTDNDLKNAEQK